MHLGGNNEHYKVGNDEFRRIVRNALNDEMFNVEDKTVVTGNDITLRLRNLKPNISSDYLEYLSSNGMPVEMPVVLAHGLFSNLTTWEVLGAELSNIGRDTWLIEITGGPGQDCDDCIDYTFYNLTDIFVPELLNGVLGFTGKDNLQYVGFSNGCRAALDSLERNQFDSNKVETFVAVGCPGSFEGNSTTGNIIAANDGKVSQRLDAKNLKHLSRFDLALAGLFNIDYITKIQEPKVSLNLFKFYENIIINKSDRQPGDINISNFMIIQGNAFTSDDGIVTVIDEKNIYTNANKNLNPKKHFNIFAIHSSLDTKDRTKSIIRKSINKEKLSFYEKTINLLNESNV
ncbi:alpha/beta hydrolase [Candidatus Woesearchaeota archaeon]|nr:alpha/beta hydrolase [Candidatus Woesearchaeota archaeon]